MKPIRLVHIDDSYLFREQFREVFSSPVADVISFVDGDSAREFIENEACDVVVVDRSGFNLAKKISERSGANPTLVVLSSEPQKAPFKPALSLAKLETTCFEELGYLVEILAEQAILDRVREVRPGLSGIFDRMSESERKKWAGKVLLFTEAYDKIVYSSDTLSDVKDFLSRQEPLSNGQVRHYHIVQAPPLTKLSLFEFENG